MIVKSELIKEIDELKDIKDDILIRKLRAIEKSIRSYTNNKFIDKNIRFKGCIKENIIYSLNAYKYLKVNDNLQLSHSLNDDVYTIKEINQNQIIVDSDLFDCDSIIITKVIYPENVQEGVINLLKWDVNMRNKVGIKAETLSRHSVTYFDMDKNNSLNGYPASLLGFLEDYCRAR